MSGVGGNALSAFGCALDASYADHALQRFGNGGGALADLALGERHIGRGESVDDALHAVFFKDRKAWDRDLRALVPHAGGEPSVTAELELPEGAYRIGKRWTRGRKGEVRILSNGQVHKQADEAER